MTSRATAGHEAREQLARALLTLAEAGQRPRCSDSPQLHLSDDPAERATAARQCVGCPLLDLCRNAGQYERHGVWGAVDRTIRPSKEKSA